MSSYIVSDRILAVISGHFTNQFNKFGFTYAENNVRAEREIVQIGAIPTTIYNVIAANLRTYGDAGPKAERAVMSLLWALNTRAFYGRYPSEKRDKNELCPEFPRDKSVPSDPLSVSGALACYLYQCAEECVEKDELRLELDAYHDQLDCAIFRASQAGIASRKKAWGDAL